MAVSRKPLHLVIDDLPEDKLPALPILPNI